MDMTLSQKISRWAVDLDVPDVPQEAIARFRLHVLDAIGCGYAAIRKQAFTNVSEVPITIPTDRGAAILGREGCFLPEQAAFANGALFHALDFDDTHGPAVLHPTAVTLATALALANEIDAGPEAITIASLVGVEVVCRVGMARHNAFHLRGFHPTSVVGTIGAAVTAGRLLGLDANELSNAIGIAGSLSCGIFAYLDGGSNPKPVHAGQAAKNGIEAARLAKVGVTGPETVFESRFGIYGAFLGETESGLAGLVEHLGRVWECTRLSIKPYPACHSMHACLDCAHELQVEHGFSSEDIEKITVFLASDRDINLVMEPLAVKVAPETGTVGKFSLPYSMATLLTDGELGIDSYDAKNLARQNVLSLASRISYEQHNFATAGKALPGAVEITLKSGKTLTAERLHERGGPDEPMSPDDVYAKFGVNKGDLAIPDSGIVTELLQLCQ